MVIHEFRSHQTTDTFLQDIRITGVTDVHYVILYANIICYSSILRCCFVFAVKGICVLSIVRLFACLIPSGPAFAKKG